LVGDETRAQQTVGRLFQRLAPGRRKK